MNAKPGSVVVGVDDVEADLRALRWAATEASLLRAPLLIIHANGGADARSVIEEAVRRAHAGSPADVPVSGQAVEGHPASVLLRQCSDARMIVLGSRRLGALGSFLLSSTGQAVAERASCPVILVRDAPPAPAHARVVVGVDADESAVLSFAFEHARRHRARLQAVACWKPDLLNATSLLEEVAVAERTIVADLLEQRLRLWRQRFPEVPVLPTVLEQRPVPGLVTAAADQQLLVVGRRGSHPISGPLLGAVSLGVLHRCRCPVAIVPVVTAAKPVDSSSGAVGVGVLP
jgi:nucleotide-binding universal stress UspA family protein